MGEGRMACGSDNNPTEYQEENRNGRRYEEHKRSRFFFFFRVAFISFVLVAPRCSSKNLFQDVYTQTPTMMMANEFTPASASGTTLSNTKLHYDGTLFCLPRCWKKTVSAKLAFTGGQLRKEIGDVDVCKATCYNHETCIGVYSALKANKFTCWLQMSSKGITVDSESLADVTHWGLTNCTDDCLSYCWKTKRKDRFTKGGNKSTAHTEDQCKEMCAKDRMCDGLDWREPNKSCVLHSIHRHTSDPIQHWEIVKRLPTKCLEAEEQCMPRCWMNTTSPELIFRDGLYKKGISSENDCKELCANNQTCTGVYWGFNKVLDVFSCWFQMPNHIVSETLTEVNYWTLSNCTSDCLPYCWLPRWENVRLTNGVEQVGISDETHCKMKCITEKNCKGVDFNPTKKKCSIEYDDELPPDFTKEPVAHWEIDRNLPTVCSDAPEDSSSDLIATTQSAPAETVAFETDGAEPGDGGGGEGGEGGGESEGGGGEGGDEGGAGEGGEGGGGGGKGGGGGGGGDDGCKCGDSAETGEAVANRLVAKDPHCPSHTLGIFALTSLLGVCLVLIIGLVAYIIGKTINEEFERDKLPWTEVVKLTRQKT